MTEIPKRTLSVMMNALSSGVVPRRGLEYIAVGRRKETETFVSDLEETSQGGGAFRFISGRYGNGKSFMIQMVRNYSMDKGFVVMDADLAINRRLTGSKGEGVNTYRELVRNAAVKARPDGGAIDLILDNWIMPIIDENKDKPEKVPSIIRDRTHSMSGMILYHDFIAVVISYAKDLIYQRESSPALRWLRGEYDRKTDARADLGVSSLIDDSNWYDMIKLWAMLSVCAGYKGMVVFLDEAVVLYKLQNRASRSNNYERLLTMFNDIMQGKSSHLSIYVCGTPEMITDPDRGLYSYDALRSRLVSGKFENGYDNYLGPVINLRPLTNEEVFVLLKTLLGMHEQRYGYESKISDDMLEKYLKTVTAKIGGKEMVTPREITRDFISLLDTMHQNPGAVFDDMIKGRNVEADRDPDNDLIDDLEI